MVTGKRVVAAYEVIGGALAVVMLAFTSTTLARRIDKIVTSLEKRD